MILPSSFPPTLGWALALALTLSVTACGGDPAAMDPNDEGGPPRGNTDASAADAGDGGPGTGDAGDADSGDGDAGATTCADLSCGAGEHCHLYEGGARCLQDTCADLSCTATEECVQPDDAPASCEDITCDDDDDCPAARHCDDGLCVDDVCTPSATHCAGSDLYRCPERGSTATLRRTCEGLAGFEAACVDPGEGDAYCTCAEDWDCGAAAPCVAGRCMDAGELACVSPPTVAAAEITLAQESAWGSEQGSLAGASRPEAAPFPESMQSTAAPVVANLDDDNGDGVIDERDTPEIVFLTYCNSDYLAFGALRAVHGGGDTRGRNYFATLGDHVWHEGDPLPEPASYACDEGVLMPSAGIAVGDLDYDGIPEIVALAVGAANGGVHVFDNTGEPITQSKTLALGGPMPQVSLANVDRAGLVEIVVGSHVLQLEKSGDGDLAFTNHFAGSQGQGGRGPLSCVADLVDGGGMEIVAGNTLYALPTPPAGIQRQEDCIGDETGDAAAFCAGTLLTVWSNDELEDGFCAVADVWGADHDPASPSFLPGPDNPLDGVPEILLVARVETGSPTTSIPGILQVVEPSTGELILSVENLDDSDNTGGPPTVADFDGDGFPEVGFASRNHYYVRDLQAPTANCPAWPEVPTIDETPVASPNAPRGVPDVTCSTDADCGDGAQFACNARRAECVCLHNGWIRAVEDDSSGVTGSTAHDFDDDGRAEIVYQDECRLRIYDGLDGTVRTREVSEHRTRMELPAIADVDGDGSAEIIASVNNESNFCSEDADSQYNAGIEVWGDVDSGFGTARAIWNQHGYHLTNVTEAGGVPLAEPASWSVPGGRPHGSYRATAREYAPICDPSPM